MQHTTRQAMQQPIFYAVLLLHLFLERTKPKRFTGKPLFLLQCLFTLPDKLRIFLHKNIPTAIQMPSAKTICNQILKAFLLKSALKNLETFVKHRHIARDNCIHLLHYICLELSKIHLPRELSFFPSLKAVQNPLRQWLIREPHRLDIKLPHRLHWLGDNPLLLLFHMLLDISVILRIIIKPIILHGILCPAKRQIFLNQLIWIL